MRHEQGYANRNNSKAKQASLVGLAALAGVSGILFAGKKTESFIEHRRASQKLERVQNMLAAQGNAVLSDVLEHVSGVGTNGHITENGTAIARIDPASPLPEGKVELEYSFTGAYGEKGETQLIAATLWRTEEGDLGGTIAYGDLDTSRAVSVDGGQVTEFNEEQGKQVPVRDVQHAIEAFAALEDAVSA